MMRCAVIDLGSNSFHLLVADLEGRTITPVLREREMLHLGQTVALTGEIPAADRDRAVTTARRFALVARQSGARRTIAVATAALRTATNGPSVLAALDDAIGAPVRVLTGDEEAALSYRGSRISLDGVQDPALVLDLGGGSLELAIGTGDRTSWTTSLPLGAGSLTAIAGEGPLDADGAEQLRARIDADLDPLVEVVRTRAPRSAIAVGGPVRAVARVHAARDTRPTADLQGFSIEVADLEALCTDLTAADTAGRLAMPGVSPDRADHVHVAAFVLARVARRLGLERLVVGLTGIREGLLLEAADGLAAGIDTADPPACSPS